MDHKIIFNISNSSTDIYNNSLTKFTNKLPEKLKTNEHEQWGIAIESIGLDFKKLNFSLPQNVKVPHIFFLSKKFNAESFKDITTFAENLDCFYFPNISYTNETLEDVLSKYNTKWGKILEIKIKSSPDKYNGKKYISFEDGPLVSSMHKVYIHEKIMQMFGFNTSTLEFSGSSFIKKEYHTYGTLFKNEPFFEFTFGSCVQMKLCKLPYYKQRSFLNIENDHQLNFPLPENAKVPHIFFLSKKFSARSFHQVTIFSEIEDCFYFPNNSYTIESFENELIKYNAKWGKILKIKINSSPNKYEGKKYISFEDGSLVNTMHKIYIHEKILQNFGFNTSSLELSDSNFVKKEYHTYGKLFQNEPLFEFSYKAVDFDNLDIRLCKLPYYEHRSFLNLNQQNLKDYDIILIKCNEIESQMYNDSYKKIIGYCVMNTNDSYVVHEFKTKEYFPISTSILSSISIEITDIHHNQLELLTGIPTFVKLHLSKMEKETKVIKVTSEKTSNHPNNTNNQFSVTLPYELNLRGRQWKVALASISFQPNFAVFDKEVVFKATYTIPVEGLKSQKVTFSPGYYTEQEVIDKINNEFYPVIERLRILKIIKENNKVSIAIGKYTFDGTYLLITISKDLLYFLGFDTGELQKSSDSEITFSRRHGETINFFSNVRLEGVAPPYILLYADFVEPSITGSVYSKILKIIPIKNSKNYTKYEFEHLEFFNTENSSLRTLNFEFRTHTGQLMNLAHNENIVMSLIFQK